MRYVAVGDSFTEGVGDPDASGAMVGWADRVAAGMAAAYGEPVQYANLAVRGRLLAPVVHEQVPAALALTPPPTLVTLNGGGNDMLRSRTDIASLVALTERAVRVCRDAGTRLVLLSGADPSDHIPLGSVVRRRGSALTAAVAELAAHNDVTFVDCFHDRELRARGNWSADRLHLNAAGHRRVAGLVLAALGVEPAGAAADAGPQVGDPADAPHGVRYYREHVLPWVGRRLRRRSSGDGRSGKAPDWVTVGPTVAI
ncbi:SGNH/GDSL hydrolase family protein [Pseudonocardia sp.]|uniref:SGNH/GDSL hydrolase family protein n=1 Tax=Pseudonocardia sp. TaxID=60912 RepID=UPI003D101418